MGTHIKLVFLKSERLACSPLYTDQYDHNIIGYSPHCSIHSVPSASDRVVPSGHMQITGSVLQSYNRLGSPLGYAHVFALLNPFSDTYESHLLKTKSPGQSSVPINRRKTSNWVQSDKGKSISRWLHKWTDIVIYFHIPYATFFSWKIPREWKHK